MYSGCLKFFLGNIHQKITSRGDDYVQRAFKTISIPNSSIVSGSAMLVIKIKSVEVGIFLNPSLAFVVTSNKKQNTFRETKESAVQNISQYMFNIKKV